MPIIGVLLLAFKAWMLIDALQRAGGRCCGSSYWFIICWVPFGDWVYFFAVKIHDPEFARLKTRLFARPASLEELRFTFKNSPSAANKLALARGLHDHSEFREALDLAQELVQSEPGNKHYLFLQASCLLGLELDSKAAAVFEEIVAKDLSFRDYDAAQTLMRLYFKLGDLEKAIELGRRVNRASSQLTHRIDLAFLLSQHKRGAEARAIIDDAIEGFKHEPKFIRRRDRKHLGKAKKLQKQLRDEEAGAGLQ